MTLMSDKEWRQRYDNLEAALTQTYGDPLVGQLTIYTQEALSELVRTRPAQPPPPVKDHAPEKTDECVALVEKIVEMASLDDCDFIEGCRQIDEIFTAAQEIVGYTPEDEESEEAECVEWKDVPGEDVECPNCGLQFRQKPLENSPQFSCTDPIGCGCKFDYKTTVLSESLPAPSNHWEEKARKLATQVLAAERAGSQVGRDTFIRNARKLAHEIPSDSPPNPTPPVKESEETEPDDDRFLCPHCGEFWVHIQGKAIITVTEKGRELGCEDWDDNSYCECGRCEFVGTVDDFRDTRPHAFHVLCSIEEYNADDFVIPHDEAVELNTFHLLDQAQNWIKRIRRTP